MRRLTAVALLLALACVAPAGAQEIDPLTVEMIEGSDSGLVRAYHFDRSGSGSSNLCDTSIGCPTVGIWFQQAVGATLVPDIGPGYVMTVAGNPTRVAAPVWPAGLTTPGYSWRLDGTEDSLSVADAAGVFAADAFSVTMAVIPRAGFASGDVFVGKWNTTGDQRSWRLYTGGTSVVLDISADGTAGTVTTLTKAACIAANRISWVTAACDGAGNCSIWVDGLAVATSAGMADAFNSTAAFSVGADAEGAGDVPADLYAVAYYSGALVAATHTRSAARFRGLYDSSLSNVVAVVAATMPSLLLAPPASGVEPFLVDQPANSTMIGAVASGSGGLYGASAITNFVQRSSFETWAAGAATGWPETPTGAGDATQNTTHAAHGSCSMQLNCPGAADAITVTGACLTVTGGAVYSLSWFDYLVSGTGALDVAIYEDDSADCSSPTGHTTIGVVPIAATWNKRTSPYTMQAGTVRAQVWLTLPAAAAQVSLVDAVQLRLGTATDAFCTADTDASAVCSTMVQSTADNGSLISANGSSSIVGTFRTPGVPAVGGTTEYHLFGDGTVNAANTIDLRIRYSTYEPFFSIFDATPAQKYIAPNVENWAANTDYTLRVKRDGNGALGLWWNGNWNTTTGGAGTGKRSASQAVFYMCGKISAGNDVWTRDLQFYRRSLDYLPPTIVVVGDSIASQFAPWFAALYPLRRTVNSGVVGNKAADVRAGWAARVTAYDPEAVLLHVGVNDIIANVSAADIGTDIEWMADQCDAAGVVLIVDTTGTYTLYSAPQLVELAALNAWLAGAFAAGHPTAIVLDFLAWAENGSGDPKTCEAGWFDATCVHPNATGYPLWAAIVKAAYP